VILAATVAAHIPVGGHVQGRGELRRELAHCLRTGRAKRRPRARAGNTGRIRDVVMISERPAEAEAARAVPGHSQEKPVATTGSSLRLKALRWGQDDIGSPSDRYPSEPMKR